MKKKHLTSSIINHKSSASQRGFTIIELLVVMGIGSILLGLTTISLLNVQHNTSVAAAQESLIADLKSQQSKAMNGSKNGGNFGVHFSTPSNNTYTLFQGTDFAHQTSTTVVTIDDGITYSGSDVVFTAVSGEISPSTITVTSTGGSGTKQIVMNKFGVVTGW